MCGTVYRGAIMSFKFFFFAVSFALSNVLTLRYVVGRSQSPCFVLYAQSRPDSLTVGLA